LASLENYLYVNVYTCGWLKAAANINRVNVYVASLPLHLIITYDKVTDTLLLYSL